MGQNIVEWKIRNRGQVWHLTRNLLKVESLNQSKMPKLVDVLSKLVITNQIARRIEKKNFGKLEIFFNQLYKCNKQQNLSHANFLFSIKNTNIFVFYQVSSDIS